MNDKSYQSVNTFQMELRPTPTTPPPPLPLPTPLGGICHKQMELRSNGPIFTFSGDTSVAFYAYLTEVTVVSDGAIVIYDNIVTNIGDGYSDISGVFTGKY